MSRKLNPAIFLTLDAVKDDGEILFGSGADGYVYQMETGQTDDGDAIDARWPTGWLDMGTPEVIKQFRYVHLHLDYWGGPITLGWEVDHGVASGALTVGLGGKGVWGSPGLWGPTNSPGVWGSADPGRRRLVYSLPQQATGHDIQLTFSSNDTSALWALTSYSVFWTPKRQLHPEGDLR